MHRRLKKKVLYFYMVQIDKSIVLCDPPVFPYILIAIYFCLHPSYTSQLEFVTWVFCSLIYQIENCQSTMHMIIYWSKIHSLQLCCVTSWLWVTYSPLWAESWKFCIAKTATDCSIEKYSSTITVKGEVNIMSKEYQTHILRNAEYLFPGLYIVPF